MTWHNKVVWTEGMFLQPQHFQQHDRHAQWQLNRRQTALHPYGWGFTSLSLDQAALSIGKLALTQAAGLLPDGTAFAMPGDDSLPAAVDVPADVRGELYVLAVPLQRQGLAETNAEEDNNSPGPRWRVAEAEVNDANTTTGRDAPVQLGRLHLRLLRAKEAGEAFATLGLVRVIERQADNRLVLDTQYIPPLLHSPAHVLTDGYAREVQGLLRQRGEALAALMAQPGRAGLGEIADFLLLQTVNRWEPVFTQLTRLSVLHPARLFEAMISLAGDLSTFRGKRRPPAFPEYLQDDLAATFRGVIDELRAALSDVLERNVVPIELQDRKYGVRVAIIPDLELQRSAQFVLAVAAQLPGEALRARFPTQVKIGTVERIRDLVNLQLPGVGLRPLPVAPRQIPYHAGFTYFELETRHSEMWKQLESSGGLAMHIAGEFPGLELEFWAIRA
ncbi:type VI secretion system baseplate subunit TssK [soil metagenome]